MGKVSTRKRGDMWYYSYEMATVEGKRKRKEIGGFSTEQEAYDAGIKDKVKYDEGSPSVEKISISVSDYLDYWHKNYVMVNLKYNTQYNYEKAIRLHLKPDLGKYKLQSLTPIIIQEWLNKKALDGYGHSSLDNMKKILTGALKFAVYPAQLIVYNPAAGVIIPKIEKPLQNPSEKVVSDDEFIRLLKRFPKGNPYYIMLMIGYYTGLRIGETLGLTWDNIDLDKRSLTVDHTLTRSYGQKGWYGFGTPKTESSYREITIGNTLNETLRKHKLWQVENELKYGTYYRYCYISEEKNGNKTLQHLTSAEKAIPSLAKKVNMVCTHPNGEFIKPASFSNVTNIAKKELKITFSYHSLRHMHATKLIENGANIKDVQRRLGHSCIDTTLDTYSHATQKMAMESVQIFEKVSGGIK